MGEPWAVRERLENDKPTGEWLILEPNPDAGKSGVSYSGGYLLAAVAYDAATARTLGAAPDLLAALEALPVIGDRHDFGCLNDGLFCGCAWGNARAAIRAARGEG